LGYYYWDEMMFSRRNNIRQSLMEPWYWQAFRVTDLELYSGGLRRKLSLSVDIFYRK